MMQITISKKPHKPAIRNEFRRQTELHTMMLPGTVMMIVFNIIPLFGLIIAFTNFKATMGWEGIFTSQWNNFRNFRQVFSSSQFEPMLRNTLGINLLGQFISIPIAILFALLLNEIRSPPAQVLCSDGSLSAPFSELGDFRRSDQKPAFCGWCDESAADGNAYHQPAQGMDG